MKSFEKEGKRKVKVLQLITVFSIGGATEHVLICSEGLIKLGYEVDILTGQNIDSEGSMFDTAKAANLKVKVVSSLKRDIHPFYDIKAFFELVRIFKNERYDIVQTHSSKAGIIGRLAAKFARVPIIIHTVHGLPFHEYQSKYLYHLYVTIEKFSARLCHHLMAVTHTIVEKSLKRNIGREEQYSVIRSSLDMEYLLNLEVDVNEMKKVLGISSNDKVIGKISRFSPLKGHKYLFDVIPDIVQKYPNVKFLLVGSGEQEIEFRELVKEKKIEKYVIFAGLIDHDKVPNYIALMDIVVHTSLLEGLARIMPQSFVLGKPIVSFDIDGAHEIIEHGQSGYLVKPMDKEELMNSLLVLLNDNEKAKAFGEIGKKRVLKEWDKNFMVSQMDLVYQSLIKKRLSDNK